MIGAELSTFSAAQQRNFEAVTSPAERKERGHFGTPTAVGMFMAHMIPSIPRGLVRVLDPGAGTGALSVAVCQRALAQDLPRQLEFELWENDSKLEPFLRSTMNRCQQILRRAGHQMKYEIRVDDFILEHRTPTLFRDRSKPSFHIAILNPPYYKVRKESAHAAAMSEIVHGQPNIYSFFMAAAADLLLPRGQLVAITPRSYFNGPYFKRFRKWFFDRMTIRRIHAFESRRDAFRKDAVLQENVILLAEKGGVKKTVLLTASVGRDCRNIKACTAPYSTVLEDRSGDHIVRLPTSPLEHEIVKTLDRLPHRFRDLGFEISTGPVVTFRETRFLRRERSADTAPLFWMHNVRPFLTQVKSANRKPAHILVSEQSERLLVPAKRYLLLKRFTAKEEKRRLVAAIMEPSDSYSEWVGLENHLNYVYRAQMGLSKFEALGLAAYFNAALVDQYFRAISGSTQVNAAEIRALPTPDQRLLVQIGKQIECAPQRDLAAVERIVYSTLRLPVQLIEQLGEMHR